MAGRRTNMPDLPSLIVLPLSGLTVGFLPAGLLQININLTFCPQIKMVNLNSKIFMYEIKSVILR